MAHPTIEITLPGWVEAILQEGDHAFPRLEDRMELVIALARRNVDEGTGGPFGAGIFDIMPTKAA